MGKTITESEQFMKIHDEDILLDIKETPNAFHTEGDVIEGGIGLFKLVGLGWVLDPVNGTAKVWLDLAGQKVRTIYLDQSKFCDKLSANVLAAKASIEICVNWNEKVLTANGIACYNKFFGWKCASFKKRLITW